MFAFYLTFIAVLVAGLGARDQCTLADLTETQGQRPAALATSIAIACLTAAAGAYAAFLIAPDMLPRVRMVLAAIALAIAGVELMLIVPRRRLAEPTRSLFALALVMGFRQMTDAARFLVFAIGVGTNAPLAAGLAGALGGGALLAGVWLWPDIAHHGATRIVRRVTGAILVAVGIGLWLRAIEFL